MLGKEGLVHRFRPPGVGQQGCLSSAFYFLRGYLENSTSPSSGDLPTTMLSICMHINIIAVLGTEPGALLMLSNQSATKLYNFIISGGSIKPRISYM